mgnify:CR=1 FL=1
MIPRIDELTFKETFLKKQKSSQLESDVLQTAKQVIDDIQAHGDKALKKYVKQFDGEVPDTWEVSVQERKQAWEQVEDATINSLKKAASNIKKFHQKQLQNSRFMESEGDVISGQLFRAIERVGIYVPGGTASYPSSVLMNAIPAILAGVEETNPICCCRYRRCR